MAFRKRNVALGGSPASSPGAASAKAETVPGVKPSTLTSHPVTSTGSSSLDGLLGGHGGLALGSSLLVEENGSTDYAGAILKYYAAEGICQGHTIHLVAMGDRWMRQLPGVAAQKSGSGKDKTQVDEEKMKIAWRYERLGQTSERALPIRQPPGSSGTAHSEIPFCHTFDLAKCLPLPQDAKISHIPINRKSESPFEAVLESLERSLKTSTPNSVHRLVVPQILHPALYPSNACRPQSFIRFLHNLRTLLSQYPKRLTAALTLPLDLYRRDTGLVCWAEILSDGVLELTPFPHAMDADSEFTETQGAKDEERPQGMVKVHKVPIDTERGEGGAGAGNSMGEDLAFTVSRRKFAIKPFSLPPLEGDQETQKDAGKPTAKDLEF